MDQEKQDQNCQVPDNSVLSAEINESVRLQYMVYNLLRCQSTNEVDIDPFIRILTKYHIFWQSLKKLFRVR